MPKIIPAIDSIEPRNVNALIVGAILGDCWTNYIDYSYEANKHEENDEQEEGNENKVNKKIKKKEVFLGEDKQPMDDNEEG